MLKRRNDTFTALLFIAPLAIVYLWLFAYPALQLVFNSFTNAPLVGTGSWVGLDNYLRLPSDRVFRTALANTGYFVLLTVIPGTLIALGLALIVNRLNGFVKAIVLGILFLPYILPISVVYVIWQWTFDLQFGVAQNILEPLFGNRVAVFRRVDTFMPVVAIITIWATSGFSILLFLAGLKNIPSEVYEAAQLDGSTGWHLFRKITWPLVWPVTALCMMLQLIMQLQVFDLIFLFSRGGRTNQTMVLVQYIYEQAFIHNKGGFASAITIALFALVILVSVLQVQALKARSAR